MERILLRNGIPEPMPRIEGTYLYQTLHVRGRRPLWLDRHTELLARNIQELFGLRWAPDLRRLEAEIAALLDANRHPVAGSSFVRMAFTPAGDLLLIPGAVSFYDGYALRSLRPAAAVVNYGVPYPEYPTSAREAACMLALQAAVTADNRAAEADIERAAVRTGVQAVIRCDGEGFVHVNIAYRWFLGIDLDEPVPDHSTFSQLRRRKFNGAVLFEELFDEVVWKCIEYGLIDGKLLLTDSTHVRANARNDVVERVIVEAEPSAYLQRLNEQAVKDGVYPKRRKEKKKAYKELVKSGVEMH